ncbi:MAG TPA: hypothetical protein DCE44_08840 [Verrucomicrobiales bacterium]|nr:hypothetical protein [Verrucomicrobiales bacterium]
MFACWATSALSGLAQASTNVPVVVQMLVPGFTVQELPIKLSNQNNLRFAPDGTLTTLGYDGRVWRLRDANGDGLEDTVEAFWDRPTLSVPLGMAWSSDGLLVSSKGKISRLRDTNGDGQADEEVIVTSGWPVTDVGSGGVDATAVTLDQEGNVYFGLLVADYSNAYRLRKRSDLSENEREWLKQNGRWREPSGPDSANDEFSLYDLNSSRGTIQKFDPRTQERTTLATGIRVPVALAFNSAGDLFNTDQEGETWMPNGNPLDELNHIIPGHNYGFPPRHERWLPELVSDPPVVAFGPQHQSACGLVFNERMAKTEAGTQSLSVPLPVSPGQALFGPRWWEGDAFVAGESRGQIWRVRLVKTPHGYVGKHYAIARLSMLTLDLAISPRGELYVCCHSGPPDWGTGPQGEGKIFKITYTDPKAPQPVAVVADKERLEIVFDRPLDSPVTESVSKFKIDFGDYVAAGDEFEALRPPYEVVHQQKATPRGRLRVKEARLSNRSPEILLVETDPTEFVTSYAITIPGIKAPGADGDGATVSLGYSLNGADLWITKHTMVGHAPGLLKPLARWVTGLPDAEGRFADLPHPDLSVSRDLLGKFASALGSINPKAELEADEFELGFRPLLPADARNLIIRAGSRFQVSRLDLPIITAVKLKEGRWETSLPAQELTQSPELVVHLERGGNPAEFTYVSRDSDREFPLSPEHFLIPDAPTNRPSSGTDSRPASKPDGDWEAGRDLFANRLQCAKCHRVRGEGGLAGPDLSNLVHRDPVSVRRDIVDPGATLHPDYVTYQAELKNGEVLVGFLRAQDKDSFVLFDAEGQATTQLRADVVNLHPTGQSLMPSGLMDGLKDTEVRDLLTFLLHEPPLRMRVEVERRLVRGQKPETQKSLRIVLVASQQDHGPGQHDYPAWQEKWVRLLGQAAPRTEVSKAWEWPTTEQFSDADVVVFYFWNHDWSPARLATLDAFQARGGGVVVIHSAMIADRDPEELAERLGLSAQPGRTGYRHMPFELRLTRSKDPLLQGLPERMAFLDEPYWPLVGDPARVNVLSAAEVDGASRPLIWTFSRGSGRVFASVLGHYFWTLDDPWFRLLVLRGIAWAGGADPERLTPVVLAEARVQ